MTEPVELLVLGVGDAFSSRYYSSCLALGRGDTWLLVDCPHPIRKMLREASESSGLTLGLEHIEALFLTHLHADHCSGVEGFLYYDHYQLQRKPVVVAYEQVLERLWPQQLAPSMEQTVVRGAEHRYKLRDYAEPISMKEFEPVQVGSFTLRCRTTKHSVPTTAVKVEIDGRTLGYSADTCFDPRLIEWLAPCDLIVHETNVGIHTDIHELNKLPDELRTKMRLIHYPDDFSSSQARIELLQQGRRYRV